MSDNIRIIQADINDAKQLKKCRQEAYVSHLQGSAYRIL